ASSVKCEDGYHGNPLGQRMGPGASPCVCCDCSGNTDSDVVGDVEWRDGRAGFFSFSTRECRASNCYPVGSVSIQCRANRTCLCRHGFRSNKCNKCQLNFYHNRATHHCQECPTCYGLLALGEEFLGLGVTLGSITLSVRHEPGWTEPINLEAVKEDMEAAKLQLEAYYSTLTELIDKIRKSSV
ncbi:hypothetical protein NHX12_028147, partial [Muraenolepis orangiensis]